MENLFTEFDGTNSNGWKAKLEKDLKGVTFEQLSSVDDNGLDIQPFYTEEDQAQPSVSIFTHNDWQIVAELKVEDEKTANAQALKLLNEGASGLLFQCDGKTLNWDVLFSEIGLEHILAVVKMPTQAQETMSDLQKWLRNKNQKCIILADTFESYDKAQSGSFDVRNTITDTIVIDTNLLFNAGANSETQLGVALAQVHEYLHATAEKNSLAELSKIFVSLSVGTLFFEEIAKIRALRSALHLLLQQYNVQPEVFIFVKTGTLFLAPFDAYNNLLRNAIAGMAGILGGANALSITNFDAVSKDQKPEFANRMGINTQLILKEESFFNQIADVSAGSFTIEVRTRELAERSWSVFQEIESIGGLKEAIINGWVRKQVEFQSQQLIQSYRTNKKTWIGINKFPNKNDAPRLVEDSIDSSETGLTPLFLNNEILNN